jgi:hypothetical protein
MQEKNDKTPQKCFNPEDALPGWQRQHYGIWLSTASGSAIS